jgi:hypothetical protein
MLRERPAVIEWPRLAFLEPLFAVIGGVGLRRYAPERMTRDLDVIVARRDAAEIERRLAEHGWERIGDLEIGGTSWQSPEGQFLDVVVGAEEWWPAMIAETQTNRDHQGLPILRCPARSG